MAVCKKTFKEEVAPAKILQIKYDKVMEGVKSVMGGRVLDYEAKDILNEGIAKGRTEGRAEEKKAMALSFYKQGVALDVIATVAGVTVEVIENLCKTLAHQVNDTAACISWCIRYPVG